MIRLDGSQEFFVGDNKPLGVNVWDTEDPSNDISSGFTAHFYLYDRDGTVIINNSAASVSGTSLIKARLNWNTASADPGKYRARAKVVYGGNTINFQWAVILLPNPAAS